MWNAHQLIAVFDTFYLHQESRPMATLVTIKTLMPVVSVSLGSPKYSLIDSRFIYIAVCIQENLI